VNIIADDEGGDLDKLGGVLGAAHRDITLVQAFDVKTAFEAFDGHDIVIVDQKLGESYRRDGEEVAAKIKGIRRETVVIINSVFPPVLPGKSDLEADYIHSKITGVVCRRGERKPLPGFGGLGSAYGNLVQLVMKIEREQLKFTQ
jgi:hypothetical protein